MTVCTKCNFERNNEDFYDQPAYKNRKARKQSICSLCIKKARKEKYENDPKYRQKKIDIACKWQVDYPERKKNKELLCYYGITLEQYNKMLEDQNGLCAICGKPESKKSRYSEKTCMLHVDHNHKNGKVRQLLCSLCNAALGSFDDDVNLLQTAIDYLNKHNT